MTSTSIRSRANNRRRLKAAPEAADEALLAEARSRARTRLRGRELPVSLVIGGGFLAASIAMAVLLHSGVVFRPATAALLVLMLAIVSRIEFEIGTGSVVPTQVVLVPMLLLLPAPMVPLFVAAGYALGGVIDHAKGRRHLQRTAVLLGNCWHAFAPALVLALFAGPTPRWHDWPIYLAALAAQFAFDFASSVGREWLAFGISPRKLLPFFRWVYTVDALLAPMGLLAAFESGRMRYAFLLTLPTVCLFGLLARERRGRIERAQAFKQAFDGAYVDARRDALTGLANRLAWDEAIARAQAAVDETATPASVIVLDVDGLKLANDSRGHEFGDDLLRLVASLVRSTVREQDVVARIGGDEVAVLLPNADESRCAEALTRLRAAFDNAAQLDGHPLSVAAGYATVAAGGSLAGALRQADARMYAEKVAVVGRPPSPREGRPEAPLVDRPLQLRF
jgi:diguanylate cyclase (GGDEF)-like protein